MSIRHRRIVAVLLLAAAMLPLAGCVSGTADDPLPTDGKTSDSSGNKAWEKTFRTKDGRIVTCILYGRGLSCDWANARQEDTNVR